MNQEETLVEMLNDDLTHGIAPRKITWKKSGHALLLM